MTTLYDEFLKSGGKPKQRVFNLNSVTPQALMNVITSVEKGILQLLLDFEKEALKQSIIIKGEIQQTDTLDDIMSKVFEKAEIREELYRLGEAIYEAAKNKMPVLAFETTLDLTSYFK